MSMPLSRQSIRSRLPLTLKSLLAIVVVGVVAWGAADYFGRISVENAFQAHLNQQLLNRAADDRFRFSRYVYSYREAAKIFVTQTNLIRFVEQAGWSRDDSVQATYHQRSPAWLAGRSIQRAVLAPRFAILLDRWGKTREVYQSRPDDPLPGAFLPLSRRLLRLSENESFLTPLVEGLYLITSQPIKGEGRKILATLVLASPIDQDFLLASQGSPAKGFTVALVAEEIPSVQSPYSDPLEDVPLRIIISSDMRNLPKGALVQELPGHHFYSEQEFYEYGASEMTFRFVTLVSKEIIEPQIRNIINSDRLRHGIQAAMLMAAFALIMILLTRRIERLSRRVADFSRQTLGRVPLRHKAGDQLELLENQFQQLTETVRDRTAELETVNTELKDFAYVVSHDLKAPLRAISQLATWLGEDYGDVIDRQGKEQLELLIGRARRMYALIDGILQYSRIGRIRENLELVDLNLLVKDVILSLAPPETMKVVIDNELPSIVCEKVRIGQVFQNLISNAIKFMDKPQGEITISAMDQASYWQFDVTDDGPGIEEKYQQKVFQIFQTLVPRDERESTGVGLSIAKKVVALHGGKIWMESEVGKGTTFSFTISKSMDTATEDEI